LSLDVAEQPRDRFGDLEFGEVRLIEANLVFPVAASRAGACGLAAPETKP
jgi:hypothetical protein